MATVLSKLLEQKAQLDARIKSLEAKEIVRKKKEDTRRKILAGAYALHEAEKNDTYASLVQQLDAFLFRPADRKLFGLQPRLE
jgi:hypothetical protein